MSVESAAPANARMVYSLLIAAGVISALIGVILVTVISYNYITRIELREPVEEGTTEHAVLPSWIVRI